jgi:hypothetical protein
MIGKAGRGEAYLTPEAAAYLTAAIPALSYRTWTGPVTSRSFSCEVTVVSCKAAVV